MLRRSLHLNIDRYSQESSSYILFENKTKTKIKIKQKNKTKQKIHTKGKKSKDTHTQIHQQIQDMWYCLSVCVCIYRDIYITPVGDRLLKK